MMEAKLQVQMDGGEGTSFQQHTAKYKRAEMHTLTHISRLLVLVAKTNHTLVSVTDINLIYVFRITLSDRFISEKLTWNCGK